MSARHLSRTAMAAALLLAAVLGIAGCASAPARHPSADAGAGSVARRLEADAAYRAGEWQRAREAYEAALAAAPGDHEARLRLGNIAFREGRYREARTHYRAILARDPRHVRARYNLAMAHLAEAERALALYLVAREGADAEAGEDEAVLGLLAALRRFAARAERDEGASDPLAALAAALGPPAQGRRNGATDGPAGPAGRGAQGP